jgi:hypothetical protein
MGEGLDTANTGQHLGVCLEKSEHLDWSVPFPGVPEETYKKFLKYHHERPDVWVAFEAVTLKLIKRGIKRYGAKAIAEVVRYHETLNRGEEFDVNNNYLSYYARAFVRKYPGAKDFFEFRQTKGIKK